MHPVQPMDNVQEGYIQVTGGRVWYRIVGANNKGIPLLVVHGGPGAPHDYLEPLEGLAGERPVVFYDQLGAGNSDNPDDGSLWTIERFVEELVHVRSALKLERVHILGQSWGGALVTEYMLTRRPEGVASLVLSSPLLSARRWMQDQQVYIAELPLETRRVIRESEASGNYDSPAYQEAMMEYYRLHVARVDPWPDYLNRAFEKLNLTVYQCMWGPSEFTVTGTLKSFERVDRLKEITAPVLLTAGRYDEVPPATIQYFQSTLPNAEASIFEDASHEHHIEKTAEYLQVVGDFLRRVEGS